MDSPLSLRLALPLPLRGQSARLQLGASELVLEAVRSGHTLLWSNGREARRYHLGLRADGELTLRLRAPKLPLRVVLRDVLAIVPGGRVGGYLHLPLVPTLQWTGADGASFDLIELLPPDLHGEWDEATGPWLHCPTALQVRFPMRTGDAKVVIPVRLYNDTSDLVSPAHLPMPITDAELREKRSCVIVAPRRLRWTKDGCVVATRDRCGQGVRA